MFAFRRATRTANNTNARAVVARTEAAFDENSGVEIAVVVARPRRLFSSEEGWLYVHESEIHVRRSSFEGQNRYKSDEEARRVPSRFLGAFFRVNPVSPES
jgi:hypothetical protein